MFNSETFFSGKKVCHNCAHYIQHYGREGRRYFPVACGHCIALRIKTRKPEQSCEHWTEKAPRRQ